LTAMLCLNQEKYGIWGNGPEYTKERKKKTGKGHFTILGKFFMENVKEEAQILLPTVRMTGHTGRETINNTRERERDLSVPQSEGER